MPVILEAAEPYEVKADDTLETIAEAKCQDLGWKVLAKFNWGTDLPKELRRALRESVGVKTSDLAKTDLDDTPEKLKLKPDTDLKPKLRIPKAWKKDGLTLEKTTVIDVKRSRPANAISILKLDKWFIPEKEKCEFKYALQGDGDRADKIQLDVYGSNYCACSDWSDGLGKYGSPTDMAEEPVYKLDLCSQNEQRKDYELPSDGWKGECTATKGILGHKTGTAANRYINVAFSPYTTHMRYWKAEADKKARLLLDPFWLNWDQTKKKPTATETVAVDKVTISWTNVGKIDYGVVEVSDAIEQRVFWAELKGDQLKDGAQTFEWDKKYNERALNGKFEAEYIDDSTSPSPSLVFVSTPYKYTVRTYVNKLRPESQKIKWEIKDAAKVELGILEIIDNKGKVVFEKPLAKAKLSGKKDFTWDGKYADDIKNSTDGTEAIPADMPYRVQIQAHSGINTPEGLALAATHTEVRLYVDPTTRIPSHSAYDPLKVKPSLNLELGPIVIGDDPTEGSTKWYRWKLAQAGYHPGPVTDDSSADTDYKTAMKEFKRSVPANGSAGAGNFTRLRLDGTEGEAENDDAKTAINTLRATDKRGNFGDPDKVSSDNESPDFTLDEVKERLTDRSKKIIVWADDRQYYTLDDNNTKDDAGNPYTSGNNANIAFGLKDYRGGMTNGDTRTTLDIEAIPRPWIPLKATPRLLSREKELTDEVVIKDLSEEQCEAMRKCIGPLRVDWTFDELPPEVPKTSDLPYYVADFVRSRYYMCWAIWENKQDVDRADTQQKAFYTNCKETLGGSRVASDYYKALWGQDKLRLEPWKTVAVSKTQAIGTIVHEHLRTEQVAKTDLWEKQIGGSGVYFRPSRVAGDGYRVRAELVFDKMDGYAFPNLKAMRDRYVMPPQVHSAAMRVWRRTSFRGYMCWGGATGNWGAPFKSIVRANYKTAHVYFVQEGGPQAPFAVDEVYPAGAGETKFKNTIKHNVTKVELQDTAKMNLDASYVWPWTDRDDFGWPWPSVQGLDDPEKYLDKIYNDTWRKFRYALLMSLVKQVECNGYMRGHLLVEFAASPAYKLVQYECNGGTTHNYWYIFKASRDVNDLDGEACPAPGCGSGGKQLSYAFDIDVDALNLPAVGAGLGAAWLFIAPSYGDRLAIVWAHEIGHHRHFEHASNGPGFVKNLHDSEANTKFAGWGGMKPPPNYGEPSGNTVTAQANARQWDRRCIMSYAMTYYSESRTFCGVCLLRNRGWKVIGLGYPGSDKGDA